MKKFMNNKVLFIILLLLAGIWGIMHFTGGNSRGSLPANLGEWNPEDINKIVISGAGDSGSGLELLKKEDSWMVKTESGKLAKVNGGKAGSLVRSLQDVKPVRLAGTKESSWQKFETDSSGTLIRLYNNEGEQIWSLVAGTVSVVGRNDVYTYVRRPDDEKVYTTKGFLGGNLQQDAASWRNQELINLNASDISSVKLERVNGDDFSIYADSAGTYRLEGGGADSARINQYVNRLAQTKHSIFADEVPLTAPGTKEASLLISTKDGLTVKVEKYLNPDAGRVLTSSHNPDAVFSDPSGTLSRKLFVNAEYLRGGELEEEGHDQGEHDHNHPGHQH